MTLARRAGAGGELAVAGGSWLPGGWTWPPTSQPTAHTAPADRAGGDHVQMQRALVVGATLAAMHLAGLTAVAHAQATDKPTGKQAARRPPTQGQVGEAWHQPQEPADASAVAGDTRPPSQSQVGESWRHQTNVPGRPAEPGGQPGWRIASLGFLAAALALAGGLAVHAATRPGRSTRVGQAP